MAKKPKQSDLINMALYDAIAWQSGLADAWRNVDDGQSEERKDALEMMRWYRELLKKRTGHIKASVPVSAVALTLEQIREEYVKTSNQ